MISFSFLCKHVEKFGFRSGPAFRQVWSRCILFAKVLSNKQTNIWKWDQCYYRNHTCFSCNNICRVLRKLFEHEAVRPSSYIVLGTRQVLMQWNKHVWSLFLHYFTWFQHKPRWKRRLNIIEISLFSHVFAKESIDEMISHSYGHSAFPCNVMHTNQSPA